MKSFQLAWTLYTSTVGPIGESCFVWAEDSKQARSIVGTALNTTYSNITEIKWDRAIQRVPGRYRGHYVTATTNLEAPCSNPECPCKK